MGIEGEDGIEKRNTTIQISTTCILKTKALVIPLVLGLTLSPPT